MQSRFTHIASDDEALTALAALAGTTVQARPASWAGAAGKGDRLFDLRDARDLSVLERDILHPAPVPRFAGAGSREGIGWTGPAIGAHNDEVYGGLLGLLPERLAELRRSGTL